MYWAFKFFDMRIKGLWLKYKENGFYKIKINYKRLIFYNKAISGKDKGNSNANISV